MKKLVVVGSIVLFVAIIGVAMLSTSRNYTCKGRTSAVMLLTTPYTASIG
jgi:hypothetical protein